MKITKTELNNLIKEEVVRQKAIINLKSRKSSILKEMEEMGYAEPDQIEGELDEGIFENIKESKKKLEDNYWKYGGVWSKSINKKTNKPFVTELPSEVGLEEILKTAEPDKYRGRIGQSNGKLIYINSKDMNWGTNLHTFGGA
jgi:hypothetical protein